MRVIGLDPGLRRTGWGIVELEDNRLRHIANGVVSPEVDADIALRLLHLYEGIAAVMPTTSVSPRPSPWARR